MITPRPVVAIHGGAGAGGGLVDQEPGCHAALRRALGAARSALQDGGDAVQAVLGAVRVLEECELFNAGRGAALCSDGSAELSAAVMRGSDRGAGAVAASRRTMHPIEAARCVLDSDQVLLTGEHADAFAAAAGATQVPNSHFVTERRLRALAVARAAERHGTVGAVCLDAAGELAAATSTGGISGQPPGRVGDSPLIGGRGGLIAVDRRGQVSMPFTTAVMPRGVWRHGGDTVVWVADA